MTPLSSIIAAATYSSREPCPNELGESGGLVRGAFCCVAELFREPCPVVSRALPRGLKGAARRNLVLGIFLLLLVDDALHLLLRLHLRRELSSRATALLLGCSGNTQCGRCCYNDDLFHEFLLQNLRIRFVNASKNRLVARSVSRSSKVEIEAPIRFAIDLESTVWSEDSLQLRLTLNISSRDKTANERLPNSSVLNVPGIPND